MPPKRISFANAQPKELKEKSSLGFAFSKPYYSDTDKQQVLAEVKQRYNAWKNGQPIQDDDGNVISYEYARTIKGGTSKARGIMMRAVWAQMKASKGDIWQKGHNQPEEIKARRTAWCAIPKQNCMNDCANACNRKWNKKDTACTKLSRKYGNMGNEGVVDMNMPPYEGDYGQFL